MNALKLHHELKARGVYLESAGDTLKVDAPAGVLTEEDRAALSEAKPALLRLLARPQDRREHKDDGRRFRARPSRHLGYTSLYDPVEDLWHDFPTKDCYPSVVALAGSQRKGGRGVRGESSRRADNPSPLSTGDLTNNTDDSEKTRAWAG